MLTQVHFLLTYTCNFECDHCFLYCSPRAEGTFTLAQIRDLLTQARRLGTVEWIYFEGGEPFLYYPVLVEGLRLARDQGFETGVVTNCYWATAHEDAALWLGPLAETGIGDLSVSADTFHHGETDVSPADTAARAAADLGLPAESICIEQPTITPADPAAKGEPVVGGGALFKGRAADKLTEGLPTRPAADFDACTHEELVAPKRVHVDAFGHVHLCQGVSIGNLWQTPLEEIVATYDAAAHPICGPLSRGGPAELARAHGLPLEGEFVDECHLCFTLRRALLERFPEQLAPRQVYGLEQET
jgi:hypothetical protein